MKKILVILAMPLFFTGCILTPYGGVSIFWTTEYNHSVSSSPIKTFRDGIELEGDYVLCDALAHPPPYQCTCNIWRAFPPDGLRVAYPNPARWLPRFHYSYMAITNSEPDSYDGHPDIQYAYTAHDALIWFYRLSTQTFFAVPLNQERKPNGELIPRARYATAIYVHISSDTIYYLAAVHVNDENEYVKQDYEKLPKASLYTSNGMQASTPTDRIRADTYLVWKAEIDSTGVIGPFKIAEKEGTLSKAVPNLYAFVSPDALPRNTPTHKGLHGQSCLADVRLGDICSHRDHSFGGGNSHSEPTCEPFDENRAARLRAKLK